MFECKIDETQQSVPTEEEVFAKLANSVRLARDGSPKGVRTVVMDSYEYGPDFQRISVQKVVNHPACTLGYACHVPSRTKRIPMNIQTMVDKWMNVLIALSVAHDKDAADAAETQIDDMLTPILGAPIKQIREFYETLVTRMKADQRVPYMVWKTFEYWHDHFIREAPDEAIVKLRRDLAEDIATMVEADVMPDMREAMINALMWREPAQLEHMKAALIEARGKGIKPRVKGRQSCLFLQVPKDGADPTEIML